MKSMKEYVMNRFAEYAGQELAYCQYAHGGEYDGWALQPVEGEYDGDIYRVEGVSDSLGNFHEFGCGWRRIERVFDNPHDAYRFIRKWEREY